MADAAIAADLDESLDIESGLTAKVTLDLAVMIYILTKLRDVILGQVLDCSFLFYCFLSAKLAKISINGAKKVFQCVSVYDKKY